MKYDFKEIRLSIVIFDELIPKLKTMNVLVGRERGGGRDGYTRAQWLSQPSVCLWLESLIRDYYSGLLIFSYFLLQMNNRVV